MTHPDPLSPDGARQKKRTPRRITADYLHNAGLYYLQRFAASREQFRTVMLRKIKRSCAYHKDQDALACAMLLEELIKKFERAGLLGDESYARGLAESLRRQGRSERAIAAKLQGKGIERDLIQKTLSLLKEIEEQSGMHSGEIQAALRLARKKKIGPFAPAEIEDNEPSNKKALGMFARAGFSYDTFRIILSFAREEAEALIDRR